MTLARPLVVLGHLWLLIVVAQAAAVPVQDTMVVSKFDETTDTILSDPTPTPSSSTDPITEEHTPSIKLLEMDIKSTISMRYAHTAVVARVKNPAKRAQEANFRVLLPETAFISGFVMTIDGKSYKAYVKEKEEAKHIYQDAVTHGFGAAHIAAKARDSNHFTVTVNVEAASTAIFNLTYEELLNRRIDVYNHAITCQPGSLVPKFTVTVYIKETANITELRVPEIRTGNEVDATKSDTQMSNVIIKRDGASAEIIFSPDLVEQKRLMQIYAEKSKESATGQTDGEGVLGQFVVQYDVERSSDGQILVNDGYFVHFFAPNLPPLNKYVVFVLDTSISMMGRKIEQLQHAMQTILSELNPGDYFSIVDFDSTVSVGLAPSSHAREDVFLRAPRAKPRWSYATMRRTSATTSRPPADRRRNVKGPFRGQPPSTSSLPTDIAASRTTTTASPTGLRTPVPSPNAVPKDPRQRPPTGPSISTEAYESDILTLAQLITAGALSVGMTRWMALYLRVQEATAEDKEITAEDAMALESATRGQLAPPMIPDDQISPLGRALRRKRCETEAEANASPAATTTPTSSQLTSPGTVKTPHPKKLRITEDSARQDTPRASTIVHSAVQTIAPASALATSRGAARAQPRYASVVTSSPQQNIALPVAPSTAPLQKKSYTAMQPPTEPAATIEPAPRQRYPPIVVDHLPN